MFRKYSCLVLLLFTATFSCKKKDNNSVTPTSTSTSLKIQFENTVDGNPIVLKTDSVNGMYVNANNDKYFVTILKYYVSNFEFISKSGTNASVSYYKLVDQGDTSTCHFTLNSIPNGTYDSIRFTLGIDSLNNHSGPQEGDLDPILGMLWAWKTGYTFFKHEGMYIDDTGKLSIFVYHYGTDYARTTVTLPLSNFTLSGTQKTATIKFDLNKLYSSPTKVSFDEFHVIQSFNLDDRRWIDQLKGNFNQSFEVSKVE